MDAIFCFARWRGFHLQLLPFNKTDVFHMTNPHLSIFLFTEAIFNTSITPIYTMYLCAMSLGLKWLLSQPQTLQTNLQRFSVDMVTISSHVLSIGGRRVEGKGRMVVGNNCKEWVSVHSACRGQVQTGLVGLLCIHAVNTWCVGNKIM